MNGPNNGYIANSMPHLCLAYRHLTVCYMRVKSHFSIQSSIAERLSSSSVCYFRRCARKDVCVLGRMQIKETYISVAHPY